MKKVNLNPISEEIYALVERMEDRAQRDMSCKKCNNHYSAREMIIMSEISRKSKLTGVTPCEEKVCPHCLITKHYGVSEGVLKEIRTNIQKEYAPGPERTYLDRIGTGGMVRPIIYDEGFDTQEPHTFNPLERGEEKSALESTIESILSTRSIDVDSILVRRNKEAAYALTLDQEGKAL